MQGGGSVSRSGRALLVVLLGVALLAGFLAGCGADQNGDQITAPLADTTPVRKKVPESAIASPTSTGTTATTTVTEVTTPEQDLPGYRKPLVLLGDMNTPEEFVLGQLYAYALRAQGYDVAVSRNIGPPSVAQEALREGSLDVYPDYLDQFNQQVAGIDRPFKTLAAAYGAARTYALAHGMQVLDPTPFSDTSGLAVTSEFSAENHIRTLEQLAKGPRVIIGAPLQFIDSKTGLPAIEAAYRLEPAYVAQVVIGDQYDELTNNQIQAAYVATTDPELSGDGYRVLSDPKGVAGFGNVIPVTTPKVIAAEGPAFATTLNKVDALLSLSVIRGLNAEVQLDHADPGQVADEFLQAHGLVPPPSSPGSP